jgi:hypothetical protein
MCDSRAIREKTGKLPRLLPGKPMCVGDMVVAAAILIKDHFYAR